MNILFGHTEEDDITDKQWTKTLQIATWKFPKTNEKQAFNFKVYKILFFSITVLYHTAVLLHTLAWSKSCNFLRYGYCTWLDGDFDYI